MPFYIYTQCKQRLGIPKDIVGVTMVVRLSPPMAQNADVRREAWGVGSMPPAGVLVLALTPTAATAAPEGHESADDQESDDSDARPHENLHHHSAPPFT